MFRSVSSSIGRSLFNRYTGTAALMTAALPLTFGAAAGVAAIGIGYGVSQMARGVLGNPMITRNPHGFLGRHTPSFTRRAQNIIGFGALGAGAGMGAINQQQESRWNLDQAISTGQLEVERPNFLGATGSLTIATHQLRHGRIRREMALAQSGIDPQTAAIGAAHIIF